MKKYGNEFVNSTKPNLIPIIALLIIAGLIWYIYNLKTDYNINNSAKQYEAIQKRIDSLESKQTAIIDSMLKLSQSRADHATEITEKLKYEKIIIRDTTYAAMCEYLTNYRP